MSQRPGIGPSLDPDQAVDNAQEWHGAGCGCSRCWDYDTDDEVTP